MTPGITRSLCLGLGLWSAGLLIADATGHIPCHYDATPQIERVNPDSILYCGRITEEGVRKLIDLLDENVKRLMITSSGGEYDAPVMLSEEIYQRRLEVTVTGPCFSGCALLVFTAGQNRSVEDAAVLGLHNSSSSAALLANHLLGSRSFIRLKDPLMERAQREQRLFEMLGLPFSLLYEPQVRIETTCITSRVDINITGELVLDMHSYHDIWIPSPAQWEEAGVRWEGSLPKSELQARARLSQHGDEEAAKKRIVFGGERLADSPERLLYKVALCEERQ